MFGLRSAAVSVVVASAAFISPGTTSAQKDPPPEVECSECIRCYVRPDLFAFELVITSYDPDLWEGNFTGWGCFEMDCSQPPIPCDEYPDEDPEQSLRLLAIATADMKPAEQRALRTHLKGKAIFVAERSAVQVIGCKGVVVAHLPVTRGQAAAIEELIRRNADRMPGRAALTKRAL